MVYAFVISASNSLTTLLNSCVIRPSLQMSKLKNIPIIKLFSIYIKFGVTKEVFLHCVFNVSEL